MAIAYPAIDPVAFSLGPLQVRWYGLAYFASILLGWLYCRRLVADERLWGGRPAPLTRMQIDDLLLWMTLGIVVGGRLGNVLIYEPAYYAANPAAILRIWEGGMAFHGGLAGTIFAMILFGWKNRVPVLALLDVTAAATPIGLFFGRLANFINGELWGRPSDAPWAMVFPEAGPLPRHPSQLYEAALEGLLLFAVLRLLTHTAFSLRRPGLTGGAFVAGYGLLRILGEFYREPDPISERLSDHLTMGMALSVPMIVAGVIAIVLALRRPATARIPTSAAGL